MFKVVQKRFLNDAKSICLFEIEAPLVAKHAQAGQFVIFRLDEQGELTGGVSKFLSGQCVGGLPKVVAAVSGFVIMLIFMAIMKELDLLVILISPTTQTMPYIAYSYMSGGMEQYSNVVAILMFLVVFLIYWIANKFFNADISQGF